MKNTAKVFLFTFLIVGLAIFLIFSNGKTNTGNVVLTNQTPQDSNPVVSEKVTLSELSNHNIKSDCWISYKEKVYDVTQFLPAHPGSAGAIIPYCGTSDEFEKAFTGQHGTSKVSMLEKIGTYKGQLE